MKRLQLRISLKTEAVARMVRPATLVSHYLGALLACSERSKKQFKIKLSTLRMYKVIITADEVFILKINARVKKSTGVFVI